MSGDVESGGPLTLQEAADVLGVHYMTAYRYVRHGMLDADKVGGTWQVELDALVSFRENRRRSPGDPTELGEPAPWSERLEARLVAGDSVGSWGVVERALTSGADLDAIYSGMLGPAMVSIGRRWETGEIDVAVEHRASVIAMRLVGRLGQRFTRRGRSRGGVIVGAVQGERHALPTAMLADQLRVRGWDVSDLGADVPVSSFVHAVTTTDDVVGVGVSVSIVDRLPEVAETCHAVRSARPGVGVAVGGRGVHLEADEHSASRNGSRDECAVEVDGADVLPADAAEFHRVLSRWRRERSASAS
ncbi:MAG: cobalamin-dependent protein [Actinomycetota bacterium]